MERSARDRSLIERIIEDCETVEKRIGHFSLTKDSFCNDHTFEGEIAYDAIMNPVYRIVEDAAHLSEEVISACPELAWHEMRRFRNFIAHGYGEIDRRIAWNVIVGDLPKLARSLEKHASTL